MTPSNEGPTRGTLLDSNPFRVLGVTPRDDRRKIIDQAEDQALHIDPAACQKARADLTNPRTRLAVELAWLPGVSPHIAAALVDELHVDPFATAVQGGLPALARVNLMSAALELANPDDGPPSSLADFMRIFGEAIENLIPETILRDVNEDRVVAGFPAVRDAMVIKEELGALRKGYTAVLKSALDAMPSIKLVETMTLLVERATQSGSRQAPEIIDDLVDSYAVETQAFLDREEQSLSSLVVTARAAAPSGDHAVKPIVDKVELVARNWSRVAKPIQISMMARGMTHQKSQVLAYSLRSLGVDLYNEHSLIGQAERMTGLLRELFAEVGDVAERLADDARALKDIAHKSAFAGLTAPLRAMCKEAAGDADFAPFRADRKALNLADSAREQLAKSRASGLPSDLIAEMSDEVAQAIVYCAIAFANETSKWSRCKELLSSAERFATAPKTKERIAESLRTVEGNAALYVSLAPIKSAPSLSTINGFGFTLYGNTDSDAASGSYMTTYYFVALFIPIFPICRYRVISSGGGSYRFLAKGPLRNFDKAHLAISVGSLALLVWLGGGTAREAQPYSPPNSPSYAAPTAPAYVPPPQPTVPLEVKPPVGTDLLLSADQIRYCLSEDIRIGSWRSAVDNYSPSSVDSFNAAVGNYNSRCGQYKYRQGALESAKAEVEGRRLDLVREGLARAGRNP